jgi:AcrR family transcriptional regulator
VTTSSSGASGPPPTQPRARARRRRPEEVRALLLDSAAELFSAHGYTRTSTRTIAAHAGVAEVLLFRHYGSKAVLFREAVQAPLVTAVRRFVDEWSTTDADPRPAAVVEGFVATLYDMLASYRGSMTALVSAQAYTEEIWGVLAGSVDPVTELFEELETVVLQYAAMSGFTGLNPPLSSRAAVGMVLGMVVFSDWFSDDDEPAMTRDRAVAELSALLLFGSVYDVPA